MIKPQVILDDGGNPAFAVIPWREYERLTTTDDEADLSDEALYDRARAEGDEAFPVDVADRLLAGENAVRVYREHRGITRKELAESIGIDTTDLSQIEVDLRSASTGVLAAIAKTLSVDVDALV